MSFNKMGYMFYLVRSGKFRSFANSLYVYPLWTSQKLRTLLVAKVFPQIGEQYPSMLEIEPTTRCNHRCTMCEHTYWNEPGVDMKFEQFKSIVDQFSNLKWIGLTGIGASFVNKDFARMFQYLKQTSKPVIEIIDTFYMIDEKISTLLVESDIEVCWMSICGATKNTYESIMVGSDFERVVNNMKTLIEVKKRKGSRHPLISFHYIVQRENVEQIVPFIKLVHSLGGEVYEILFTILLHQYQEAKNLFTYIPEDILNDAHRTAKECGINISYNPRLNAPPIQHCVNWTMPFIFATGHVIPCCVGNEANNREFQKKTALGNVFEQSFKDIWFGEKYVEFRRKIRNGEVPAQCVGCVEYDTNGAKKNR